jgi:hypothetical protein
LPSARIGRIFLLQREERLEREVKSLGLFSYNPCITDRRQCHKVEVGGWVVRAGKL